MRWFIVLFSVFVVGMSAYATSSLSEQGMPDDGSYLQVQVTSFETCSALCKADKKCRGAVAEQPDITKPEMVCRLNDGFGSNPQFPSVPPAPFNINIAVADLNAYRKTKGLSPVILNDKLTAASKVHALDLAKHGIISHTGTDGSGHGDRVQRQGYQFSIAAENVATGQKSWETAFEAWQKSPGHNENLLRDDVTEFGIALIYEPKTTYQTYWAMIVASPFKDLGPGYTYSYQSDDHDTGANH